MDPKTIGMIVLGVAFVAFLVAAFFSAKTWHWGHVTLVLLIFLAGAGASVLAADVLSTRHYYQKMAHERQQQLDQLTKENRALQTDTFDEKLIQTLVTSLTDQLSLDERIGDKLRTRLTEKLEAKSDILEGIGTLESKLQTVTRNRGRVWRGVRRVGIDQQTGEIAVGFPPPNEGEERSGPVGIEKDMVLFVFEEGFPNLQDPSQGAQYIGKFQVIDVAENAIKISPIMIHSWTPRHKQRLASSDRTWSLYETMPIDNHDTFAFPELTPEERTARLKSLFPQHVDEYIRDGQPWAEGDPLENRTPYTKDGQLLSEEAAAKAEAGEIDWLFVRTLHDYGIEFSDMGHQRVKMQALLAGFQRDIDQLQTTIKSAEEDLAKRTEEKLATTHDLKGFRREREAMTEHLQRVEQKLVAVTRRLEQCLEENGRHASQIAAAQLKIMQALSSSADSL